MVRRDNLKKTSEKAPLPFSRAMLESIGRCKDPGARLVAMEALWARILDEATAEERGRLNAMKDAERQELIMAWAAQLLDQLRNNDERP